MNDDDNLDTPKSKSQIKREMLDLQKLGETLVQLKAAQLAQFDLPEPLQLAIHEARRLTSNLAIRRQLQYIGKLMRGIDPEPIQKKLDIILQTGQRTNAVLHQLEQWRDALIAQGDSALTQILEALPNADRQLLRNLMRNAQKERAQHQPPHATRQLFRYLKELNEQQSHNTE